MSKSKTSDKKKPLLTGMRAAANALGVDIDTIKAAKRAGCPAFRSNGAISGAELKAWLKRPANRQLIEQQVELRDKKTFEEWRRLKVRNDREEALLISRAAVAATAQRLTGKFKALLEQKLLREYPAAVAGMDVPQARIFGQRVIGDIYAEVQTWADEWPK